MTINKKTTHATAVGVGSQGLLVIGASGSGKSTLALEMIALGATLVADDKVELLPKPEGALWMSCPKPLCGLIEARGVGLLSVPHQGAFARAVVDLDQVETERLPKARETDVAGITLPLLHRVESRAFASILMVYLKGQCQTP